MKKVECYTLGIAQVNTYVVWNERHVLVVDPGSNPATLIRELQMQDAIVDAVVLTHGHFDHIAGIDDIVKAFSCPVYVNPLDKALLKDPILNVSMMEPIIVQTSPKYLQLGKQMIGTFQLEVIDAPGHTEGSSLIIWENHMFSGDVLFKGSIGRTDFVTGSNSKMQQSLALLKQLDPSYIVHPGHGPNTTLQQELLENPYLR